MSRTLCFLLAALAAFTGYTQPVSNLNTGKIVELECVQTSVQTFIAASMERVTLSPGHRKERVLIHRSTDLGASWTAIDTLTGALDLVDPVLAADDSGNVYLVVMKLVNRGTLTVDLDLYRSADDGLSWQYRGSPNLDSGIADYPQILARGNGELYLLFTRLTPGAGTFYGKVIFKRSFDGGISWTTETALGPDSITPVGADITRVRHNHLLISYGNGSRPVIYTALSGDNGHSWTALPTLQNSDTGDVYNITKPIAHPMTVHTGIITHQPHQTNTPVNYHYSNDSGRTWSTHLLATGAYAQGWVSDSGHIHLIYNQKDGNAFRLLYITSRDSGQSFSLPVLLYTAPFGTAELGEYQSLIMGRNGYFYLAFCDWSDDSKAKMLVFPPFFAGLSAEAAARKAAEPWFYPNPVRDVLYISLRNFTKPQYIAIYDSGGKVVQERSLTGAEDAAEWDLSQLSAGVYYLHLEERHRRFVERLVKR